MQLDIIDAIEAASRRDAGIKQVSENADEANPGWRQRAYAFVREFVARTDSPFLAEDIAAAWTKENPNDQPHDGRAWGHVMRAAAGDFIIRKIGYAPANSSNRSPKVLWARFDVAEAA